jgi:hypothetical protein
MNKIVGFIAFVVAGVGVRYLLAKDPPRDTLTAFGKQQAEHHRSIPENRAEAITEMRRDLDGASNALERKRIAAFGFRGFARMNTEGRVAVCSRHGANLSAFVRAFESVNACELEMANGIVAEVAELAALDSAITSDLRRAAEKDMADVAASRGTTLEGACRYIADHSDEVAVLLRYAIINPAGAKALGGCGHR